MTAESNAAVKTAFTGECEGAAGNDVKTLDHLYAKLYGYGGDDTLTATGGGVFINGGKATIP